MTISRREIVAAVGLLPWSINSFKEFETALSSSELPAKSDFQIPGLFLNAAYVHPMNLAASKALGAYARIRFERPEHNWPFDNARDGAVAAYARLINAAPTEVAVVPSTTIGENMVAAALNLGPDRGVVTDGFHYAPSLALYGELRKLGVPIKVVKPRDGQVHLSDIEKAIDPETRLISVSFVSTSTGFIHNLKSICDMAHSRNVLVYADLIQGVGAVPFDVKASGIDFGCCGGYKWLQGDFGAAFLYARPESLRYLARPQVGWRQIRTFQTHAFPWDPPGDPIGEWSFHDGLAGLFEVASPSHPTLWCLKHSIEYVLSHGVENIAAYRKPMIDRLHDGVKKLGFSPLSVATDNPPMAVFYKSGITQNLAPRLAEQKVFVSISSDRIRIAPSIYNDMNDIEAFLSVLHSLSVR